MGWIAKLIRLTSTSTIVTPTPVSWSDPAHFPFLIVTVVSPLHPGRSYSFSDLISFNRRFSIVTAPHLSHNRRCSLVIASLLFSYNRRFSALFSCNHRFSPLSMMFLLWTTNFEMTFIFFGSQMIEFLLCKLVKLARSTNRIVSYSLGCPSIFRCFCLLQLSNFTHCILQNNKPI